MGCWRNENRVAIMHKCFKKQYICILIVVIVCILIIHKTNVNNIYDTTTIAETLTRDFVLSDLDDNSFEETTAKPVPTKKNKVNVYVGKMNHSVHKPSNMAYLKTWGGKKPIFVHPRESDKMVSSRLRDFETWEEDLLNQTGIFIRRHPGITFVDLGCNIGVYTLFVATLGVRVVAVDPIEENLDLLHATLRNDKLEDNVTIVLNAISDKYQTVNIEAPRDNVGGAHVVNKLPSNGEANVIVLRETIVLDDLVPYIKDENVLIKMDIEGHEWNAINGAQLLFKSKNVRGILMEWIHHKYTDNGKHIIDFLLKEGLLPYTDVMMSSILDPESYYLWPENVFWIKR